MSEKVSTEKWNTDHDYPWAGRQVPIFSYFFQHTPIFPIF